MARSIEYRILEETDLEDVWNIILRIYHALESTVTVFKFSTEDLRKVLRKSVKVSISQRVSLGAFDSETKKLVGIVLGSLGRLHWLTNNSDEELSQQMKQHKAITQYFVGADPPATFGTREYLRIILMVSDPDFSEDDVETELCKRCEEIASRERCKKIVSVVSSASSRKLLQNFGFVTEKTLNVRDYQDPVTGERILADLPREPDSNITLEVKHLRD